MKNTAHKKITEFFINLTGGKGVNSVVTAVLVSTGLLLIFSGADANPVTEIEELRVVMILLGGLVTTSLGLLSGMISQFRGLEEDMFIRVLAAVASTFFYSLAFLKMVIHLL